MGNGDILGCRLNEDKEPNFLQPLIRFNSVRQMTSRQNEYFSNASHGTGKKSRNFIKFELKRYCESVNGKEADVIIYICATDVIEDRWRIISL